MRLLVHSRAGELNFPGAENVKESERVSELGQEMWVGNWVV